MRGASSNAVREQSPVAVHHGEQKVRDHTKGKAVARQKVRNIGAKRLLSSTGASGALQLVA